MISRVVSFGRGARWLGEGWQLFRAAPLAWLALVFAYWLLMTLVSLVPLVGPGAAMVLVPVFSVGFMSASRSAERAQRVELTQLFDGFRERLPVQLALGGAYLAGLALVIGATMLADEGQLARWLVSGQRPPDEAIQDAEVPLAFALAASLYAPLMAAFWYAPLLVAWHGFGAAKALFYSFFAFLINWRAFLAYAAAVALVTLVVPTLVLSALALASGGALRVPVMSLVLPLLLVMLPTLFASFYASYRDVFGLAPAKGG